MHSWIFRHRARLLQIYGRVPPPPLPGARFAPAASAEPAPANEGRARGFVERTARHVVLRPMPRARRPA